jgi:ferric-dicitrate binding protein FerR (iron transport regulator)
MNTVSSDKDPIDDLILGYLNHRLTKPELTELLTWIELSEANKSYFNEMQDLWKTSACSHHLFDGSLAYQRFRKRFLLNQRKGKTRLFGFVRWAAIWILVFSLGAVSYYIFNDWKQKQTENQYTLYVPYGAKTRMELPDKSMVWLNAGSTLRYASDFGKKSRKLFLEGEGYFEVTKNPAMPFVVNTKEVSVKVLGTKFDVKAYAEDDQLNVTLLQGSVHMTTIYEPSRTLALVPNQRAVIDKTDHQVVIKDVKGELSSAWTQGQIVFDEESFGKIARRLEREYNVIIDVKRPQLNHIHFYGVFRQDQSIEEIFDIITANKDFHYTKQGNKITVY